MMRQDTELWWREAEADLGTARVLLAAARYYACSFFSQQAVEKGLKALFTEHRLGAVPPRTHDLEFLGDELSVPTSVRGDLTVLNAVFQEVRYPDLSNQTTPDETFTEATAREHFDAAERFMTWLSAQLHPPSIQP